MNSRRLDEQALLQKLSQIHQLSNSQKAKRKSAMSMDEAMYFYSQYIAANTVVLQPDKQVSVHKGVNENEVREVIEVSKILEQRRKDARERQKRDFMKEKKDSQEETEEFTLEGEVRNTAFSRDSYPYEGLDCTKKEGFLLYSYNKTGNHAIIGKDTRPGSYGDHITSGEFGTKA